MRKKLMSLLLALSLLSGLCAVSAAPDQDAALQDAAAYLYKTVSKPQVGSIGGEWAVIGLARSGYAVPDAYYQDYCAAVEDYVEEHDGVLHDRKYTDYSRVILALSALGRDARDVAGYDLTLPLGDYEKTIWQGINGPTWALIALDSAGYPMPKAPAGATQATREMYVDYILTCQLSDGGWSLTGKGGAGTSDPDITGMVLQALANYQTRADVKEATDQALDRLSQMQESDGGYSSYQVANSESVVQVLVALCALDIPLDDARFVKDGHTVLDNLLSFYTPGKGFRHTGSGGGSNQMAAEQGLYGLAAVHRAQSGKNRLYDMTDALTLPAAETPKPGSGLPGKHEAVKAVPLTGMAVTFPDLQGHAAQTAVEALAARGIISGKDDGRFDPGGDMTRAEFATIIVKALGLTPKTNTAFTDVGEKDWFAPYVGAANAYGIVNGAGDGTFGPDGTISREQAAVMVANAAKLCGMDTALSQDGTKDMLAQFLDYRQSSQWAQPALAFCYREDLLPQSDLDIRHKDAVKRGEIAQMLYQLLDKAELL